MTLEETSREMRTQSNRHTQNPLFVVQEEIESRDAEGWADRVVYVSNAGGDHTEISEETYDVLEDSKCDPESYTKEQIDSALEEACLEDLKDFDRYEWERLGISVKWEISDRAGFFFTEKACEEHIAQNSYHYNKPRSYVISAWRNPEMVAVMQSILKLTGDDIPNYYG